MKAIKLLVGSLRFKIACMKADLLHEQKGFRYYVIPHPNKKGKLLAISKDDIRLWRKMKMLNKNIDHIWIMNNCLYFTDADGKNVGKMKKERIEEKHERWMKHLESKK